MSGQHSKDAEVHLLPRLSTTPASGTHPLRPSAVRGLHFAGSARKEASTQSAMASGCGDGMLGSLRESVAEMHLMYDKRYHEVSLEVELALHNGPCHDQ